MGTSVIGRGRAAAGAARYTRRVVASPPRRQWPVVLAVQLGILLAALDATVVGTAMPTVVATLGDVGLYPWVFSAYMLASTVVMPVFGAVSDRLGRKRPYLAALAIFVAGSLVVGAAPSMSVLIAGRAIQGIGAGGLLALSLIIFGDLFSGPRRGQMQGWITGVWGVASVVGPVLGGVIVDLWGWRWVFYPNLPLGALVMLLVGLAFHGPAAAAPRHQLDLEGVATFLLGVTALMVAVLRPADAAGQPSRAHLRGPAPAPPALRTRTRGPPRRRGRGQYLRDLAHAGPGGPAAARQ